MLKEEIKLCRSRITPDLYATFGVPQLNISRLKKESDRLQWTEIDWRTLKTIRSRFRQKFIGQEGLDTSSR